MKIAIVGGGIGGLSAALALRKERHEVVLLERAAAFSPVGAGIIIAPNAAQLLGWLGVGLEPHGERLRALEIVRANGTLLQRIDTAGLEARHGPTWSFARPELHQALLAALGSDVELRLGASVGDFEATREGVRIEIDGEPRRFDLLVGADGLRSSVRERLVGALPYRYSGVTCFRGIVSNPGFDRAIEVWGDQARIGAVPLSRSRLYFYLVHSAAQRSPPLEFPSDFKRVYGGLGEVAERLFGALVEPPPLHHDLEELEAPVWGRSNVLLLGDAAHAMTPNQGQGAAMAIEDAVALAHALRGGVDGALERYVRLRHARVRKVQLDSRRIGQLAHVRAPLFRWMRDQTLRLLPRAVGDRQYSGVVEPGLSLLARVQG